MLCTLQMQAATPVREALDELDRAISQREVYRAMHEQRIRNLKELLGGTEAGSLQQYSIHQKLVEAYEAYQFDSTLYYLGRNLEIAKKLGSSELRDETLLHIAHLSATSGHYLEAAQILNEQIDTAALAPSLRGQYYLTQRRFHSERGLYTRNPQEAADHFAREGYYTARLLTCYPEESEIHRRYLGDALLGAMELDRAEEVIDRLLATTPEATRSYAIYAYTKSLIMGHRGLADDQIIWLARSATADLQSATRDNASLNLLSQILFRSRNDIKSAFRYIQTSMDDAVFYNARLRPWQIASSLPIIEQAYSNQRREQLHLVIGLAAVLLALLIVLAFTLLREARRKRRVEQISHELQQANLRMTGYIERLSQINEEQSRLNNDIREANAVKEEYIGLFLGIYSDFIDRIKELQRSTRKRIAAGDTVRLQKEFASPHLIDNYIEEFYNTFDNAFLKLYPDFVEEFNSLLRPEARIELKEGKHLSTELRIFALIRLGITDSSKIAALLRYSVNTIYNYRAKVKSNALVERGSFEEQIKRIGSFRNE